MACKYATIFNSPSDGEDLRMYLGERQTTKGYVTYKEATNLSIEEERIFLFYYSFSLNDEIITGQSYGPDYYDVDEEVTIQYLADNPGISKIEDHSNTKGGIVFILIFIGSLLITSFLLIKRALSTKKSILLVQRGKVIEATKANSSTTGVRINERDQYKIQYEFELAGEKLDTFVKTTYPSRFSPKEKVVYLPEDPTKTKVISTLPPKVQNILLWQ